MANRLSWTLLAAVTWISLFGGPAVAADDAPTGTTRVLAGVRSAETLKSDLKYLIDLAQKGPAWDNLIKDNIDIFLIGVVETLPVRVDIVVDAVLGQRNVWAVPLSDVKDFIENNLDPIDIKARRSRNDPNFYELSGSVIEEGFMRIAKGSETYAVISLKKEDVPATMPHPSAAHEALVKEGYGSFLHVQNQAAGQAEREKSFSLLRENTLGGLQKRPEESKEAFELRKFSTQQTMDFLGRLFAETGETKLGTRINRETVKAGAELLFSALADSPLAKAIDTVEANSSLFSAIPVSDTAILSVKVNFPLDSRTRDDYKKLYELTRPVAIQEIDEDKETSAGEKAARKKVADRLLNTLTANTTRKMLDVHVSIEKSGDRHNILLAIGCGAHDEITALFKELPGTKQGWTLAEKVAEVQGVAIHKLSLGTTTPVAAKAFYGESGEVFLAVGLEAFWLAAGDGSLERLQGAINAVKEQPAGAADGTLVDIKAQIRPLLDNIYQFSKEENFSLMGLLQGRGIFGSKPAKTNEKKDGEEAKPAVGEGLRAHAATLRSFEWQQPAIDAMKGFDDTLLMTLKRTDAGKIEGTIETREALMRAAGALVAKFAEENFK